MDLDDIKRINTLWEKIYPYLAYQIRADYHGHFNSVLELGPFSGGISLALLSASPGLNITIADESSEVLEYLKEYNSIYRESQTIKLVKTELNDLCFESSQFDLVLFRGAFFFLSERENLLQEIYRVLKKGGLGFIGGGFGRDIPESLIVEIAAESRELNAKLGRKWLSVNELENIVTKSGMARSCRIVEEGGLWLYMKK